MTCSSGADYAAALRGSWVDNASAWTRAVRDGTIASRRLATDAAVLAAVSARSPRKALDLGCGEGWLSRALAARGIEAVGIDASASLVAAAEAMGGARFLWLGYEEIARDPALAGSDYDVVVANFALFEEVAAPLLAALRGLLTGEGALIIQTLHPWSAGGPYRDGWREENFAGMAGSAQWTAMPWYFRTIGSWVSLLRTSGYTILRLDEPPHPETGIPASLLITAAPLRPAE